MATMSAKRHLRELQRRAMIVAAFFIGGACLAYSYQDQIVPMLLGPLGGQKLVYLTPGGGFSFVLMITVYAGLAVCFPILIQQLYSFLRPALPANAQKKSPLIIICSLLLLVAGILFGYFVAVPNALHFLYGFADKYVDASLTAESYLSFIVAYTIGIGITFQVPLLLMLVHSIKPLKPGGLMKSERWIILGAFIVAAIITPTVDPVNQLVIAGPVIVVYQLGVIAVLINIAQKARRTKKLAKVQTAEKIKHEAEVQTATKQALVRKAMTEGALPDSALPQNTQKLVSDMIDVKSTSETAVIQQLQKTTLTIDGVVRRQAPQLQIPKRPEQGMAKPAPRTAPQADSPRPQGPAARGFYLDGIMAVK